MSFVEWLEPPPPEDSDSHPAQANATPEAMAFFLLQGGQTSTRILIRISKKESSRKGTKDDRKRSLLRAPLPDIPRRWQKEI